VSALKALIVQLTALKLDRLERAWLQCFCQTNACVAADPHFKWIVYETVVTCRALLPIPRPSSHSDCDASRKPVTRIKGKFC
jgi:hypothetical protein